MFSSPSSPSPCHFLKKAIFLPPWSKSVTRKSRFFGLLVWRGFVNFCVNFCNPVITLPLPPLSNPSSPTPTLIFSIPTPSHSYSQLLNHYQHHNLFIHYLQPYQPLVICTHTKPSHHTKPTSLTSVVITYSTQYKGITHGTTCKAYHN